MPDYDEAPHAGGREPDEQDLAVERLERALERIAAAAHRAAAPDDAGSGGAIMDAGRTREVAARLDALIAQLRGALARD